MDERRQNIQRWFDEWPPELPARTAGVCLLLLVVGLLVRGLAGGVTLLAGVAVASLVIRTYNRAKAQYLSRPAANQMLQWFHADVDGLKEASLRKFGLTPQVLSYPSTAIVTPIYWDAAGLDSADTRRRRGVAADSAGPYLYACWEVSVIHFAVGCLMCYRCNYDWFRGEVEGESTQQVTYDHLVMVKTEAHAPGHHTYDGPIKGASQLVLSLSNQEPVPPIVFNGATLQPANHQEVKQAAQLVVQAIYRAKSDWMAGKGRPFAPASAPVAVAGFCTICGWQRRPGERFCQGCGSRL